MVFKKSFTLLVATGTTRFFVVVPIISEKNCSIRKQRRSILNNRERIEKSYDLFYRGDLVTTLVIY